MKDTELREERDRALFETYTRGLATQHFSNMHDAVDWCREQPAPKFYISSRALSLYIGRIIGGDSLGELHFSTREQVMELYSRFLTYAREHSGCGYSRARICEIIVDDPAPKFYISSTHAISVLQKERMKRLR